MELRSLEVRPWVRVCGRGLGPAQLKESQRGSRSATCRGRALSGHVEVGLRLCTAGGSLRRLGIGPRSPTGSPVPKWAGKALAMLPSIPPLP